MKTNCEYCTREIPTDMDDLKWGKSYCGDCEKDSKISITEKFICLIDRIEDLEFEVMRLKDE